jgi:hypothetical protein
MTTINTKGKIYIASMNLRGKWADPIDPTSIKVNVTSAQATASKNRRDFSPMTEIEGGYMGYDRFESRWQAGKVFEGIPEETVKAWWRAQTKPKRRYPKGKGKKVLYAKFDGHEESMDYITARKEVYVKEYGALIRNREMTLHWKKMLEDGKSITIYDFDGPRLDKEVTCLEFTPELFEERITLLDNPFGHGYIVAGIISGFM